MAVLQFGSTKRFWAATLSAAAITCAGEATAKEFVRCTAPSRGDITIELSAERRFGRVLDCITGDFIADMTPCAPDGGWGLSIPTGTAALGAVVFRWQDYIDHTGGVTGHFTSGSKITFNGGFVFSGTYTEEWAFEADRLSGAGTLKQKNKPAVHFACAKARAKF